MTTSAHPEILRADEASQLISREKDPITRALLNNANFCLIRKFFERGERPESDIDLLFFVELMREMFHEHDVLRKILFGKNVGQFFDDDSVVSGELEVDASGEEHRQVHPPGTS